MLEKWLGGRPAKFYFVAAIVVFVGAAIIQAACGSCMFSSSYSSTSLVQDLLINVTFWPGWLLTAVLILAGVGKLMAKE